MIRIKAKVKIRVIVDNLETLKILGFSFIYLQNVFGKIL